MKLGRSYIYERSQGILASVQLILERVYNARDAMNFNQRQHSCVIPYFLHDIPEIFVDLFECRSLGDKFFSAKNRFQIDPSWIES